MPSYTTRDSHANPQKAGSLSRREKGFAAPEVFSGIQRDFCLLGGVKKRRPLPTGVGAGGVGPPLVMTEARRFQVRTRRPYLGLFAGQVAWANCVKSRLRDLARAAVDSVNIRPMGPPGSASGTYLLSATRGRILEADGSLVPPAGVETRGT